MWRRVPRWAYIADTAAKRRAFRIDQVNRCVRLVGEDVQVDRRIDKTDAERPQSDAPDMDQSFENRWPVVGTPRNAERDAEYNREEDREEPLSCHSFSPPPFAPEMRLCRTVTFLAVDQ